MIKNGIDTIEDLQRLVADPAIVYDKARLSQVNAFVTRALNNLKWSAIKNCDHEIVMASTTTPTSTDMVTCRCCGFRVPGQMLRPYGAMLESLPKGLLFNNPEVVVSSRNVESTASISYLMAYMLFYPKRFAPGLIEKAFADIQIDISGHLAADSRGYVVDKIYNNEREWMNDTYGND